MRPLTDFAGILRRFRRDKRGVSAVEFAMVLPLMIILFVGVVQVSEIASLRRKATLVARSVADLTAQVSNINQAEMNNVMNAGEAVIAPFPVGKLMIRVSSVKIDGAQNVTVAWSKTNASTGTCGTTDAPALESALKVANTSLIMAEVCYTYNPYVGYLLSTSLNLTPSTVKDKIYMRPRLSEEVKWIP